MFEYPALLLLGEALNFQEFNASSISPWRDFHPFEFELATFTFLSLRSKPFHNEIYQGNAIPLGHRGFLSENSAIIFKDNGFFYRK